MIEIQELDLDEALREGEPDRQRLLTIVMLIFSLGFCALVFWAGWKETSAYERCGLHGVLTVGRSCPAAATPALSH
jgi:TRAP-type C4-dicarboxylate transport system permease small subunit